MADRGNFQSFSFYVSGTYRLFYSAVYCVTNLEYDLERFISFVFVPDRFILESLVKKYIEIKI